MLTAEKEYIQYCSLHQNFSLTYFGLNKRMTELYPEPKKFLEETGPIINQYVQNFVAEETNPTINESLEQIFYFSNSFSDFNTRIVELFDNYQTLHEESTIYIKKTVKIKEENQDEVIIKGLIDLTPQVNDLVSRLQQLDEKSKVTESNFRKLQNTWSSIKKNIQT